MPRRERLVLPDIPLHIIQRGNNRQNCFYCESDYLVYLTCLREHADAAGCRVHAYVLMTNHVHLLVSVDERASPGAMMKALGQQYVQYVNRRHRRSGSLWEGRYRSCLVQTEGYVLNCQRYIEMNPVRAGMVEEAAQYRWSSYHGNTGLLEDRLLKPHAAYEALASELALRQARYRQLCAESLPDAIIDEIRRSTNGNFALGDAGFIEEMAAAFGRRVRPGKPGRPKRKSGTDPDF